MSNESIATRLRRRSDCALDRDALEYIERLERWQEAVRNSSPLLARLAQLEAEHRAVLGAVRAFLDGRMAAFKDSRAVDDDLVMLALAVSK